MPHDESGRLYGVRLFLSRPKWECAAVPAAEKRNGFLPDVPTLREAGIDMVSDIRRCFAAPKGIKPAELDALRVLFKKICEDPEYLADMKKAGQPAEYMDGEAFAAYIAGQQAHAQEALSAAGLLKK